MKHASPRPRSSFEDKSQQEEWEPHSAARGDRPSVVEDDSLVGADDPPVDDLQQHTPHLIASMHGCQSDYQALQ